MEILLDKDSAHFVSIGYALLAFVTHTKSLMSLAFFQLGAHLPPTPSHSPLTVAYSPYGMAHSIHSVTPAPQFLDQPLMCK